VNAVISKRFAKRQQMQWTKRGAHLLLQTRTRTLHGTLRSMFERWHPGLANDNISAAAALNPIDPDALADPAVDHAHFAQPSKRIG